MPIPESQLDTWSNRGAQATAKKTHEHIQKTIANSEFITRKTVDTYLQGSYRNTTNIYGNSDVDIVAENKATFFYNIDLLSQLERERFHAAIGDSTYSWSTYRTELINALRNAYGWNVDESAKRCVKIEGSSGRLDADVVVAFPYRVYSRFNSVNDCKFEAGIRFQDQGSFEWIVNYPKQHYENGTSKNSLSKTQGNYKHTVRMFKNARQKLIRDGYISKDLAPSYFLECLLFNVPDYCFIGTYREKFLQVLKWLENQITDDALGDFECQNRQDKLFGFSFVQWREYKAKALVEQLRNLWDGWD